MTIASLATEPSFFRATTPEEYFEIPKHAPRSINVDALNAALSRALSVIHLLEGDGSNKNEGFTFNHETIVDALWCIEGLIIQAQKIAEHAGGANHE